MSIDQPDFEIITKEAEQQELSQLLKSGKFDQINQEVTLRAMLTVEILQTRAQYETSRQLGFLNDMDWEALTMLKLYDEQTFEHSINTYTILKHKLDTIKHKDLTLAEIIDQEGYSLNQLLRAAVLHDAGKIKIPNVVIKNHISRGEWREIFEEQPTGEQISQLITALNHKEWEDNEGLLKLKSASGSEDGDEDEKIRQFILDYIDEKQIPATQLVPIRKGMTPEDINILIERGFNPDESLGSIMRNHEKFTGDVLSHLATELKKTFDYDYSEEDLNKIIEIATHHHNYDRDEKFLADYPATATSLNISSRFASLISMADLKEAMESHARAYRNGGADLFEIFNEFINHAKRGFLDKHYTALWLESDLKELEPEELSELQNSHKHKLQYVLDWIAKYI